MRAQGGKWGVGKSNFIKLYLINLHICFLSILICFARIYHHHNRTLYTLCHENAVSVFGLNESILTRLIVIKFDCVITFEIHSTFLLHIFRLHSFLFFSFDLKQHPFWDWEPMKTTQKLISIFVFFFWLPYHWHSLEFFCYILSINYYFHLNRGKLFQKFCVLVMRCLWIRLLTTLFWYRISFSCYRFWQLFIQKGWANRDFELL